MTITLRAADGVELTAKQWRQSGAAAHGGGSGRQLGGRSGWRVGTPDNVLTATSTTWTLGPCAAMIDPLASTHQGMYGWSSDANVTGSVDAADATYARKDIVYIRVNDSSSGDGSGQLTANVYYLAGSPTATPEVPTVPQRGFLVGTISVPAAGGGAPTVQLNPARYVAAGAPLPVDLAARDALTKYDTLKVQRTDVPGRPEEVWDATANQWKRDVQIEIKAATPAAPKIKAGVVSASSDANGTCALVFDEPFPTAIFMATATQAKAANIGAIQLIYDEGLSNPQRAAFFVYDMAGALLPNLINFRVCYTAFGH